MPMMWEQTMNAWFAERKEYDISHFRIVQEGWAQKDLQHNEMYDEGTKP